MGLSKENHAMRGNISTQMFFVMGIFLKTYFFNSVFINDSVNFTLILQSVTNVVLSCFHQRLMKPMVLGQTFKVPTPIEGYLLLISKDKVLLLFRNCQNR